MPNQPNPQPSPPAPALTTCPSCGKQLHYVDTKGTPEIAPWWCDDCDRAWWPSELLPKYRSSWNPVYRDFGKLQPELDGMVRDDRDTAVKAQRIGGQ